MNSRAETFISQSSALPSTLQTNTESSFSSDRPGIGLSSSVVSPGTIQMEGGSTLSRARFNGATAVGVVLGSPLTRWGIAPGLEVRFQGDGYRFSRLSDRSGVQRLKGFGDTNLGTKIRVAKPAKWKPEVALVAELWMPSGEKKVSRGGVLPSASVIWSNKVPGKFTLGGTASVMSVPTGLNRMLDQAVAVSISRPLWKGLSGFTEGSYDRLSAVASNSPWMFDAGFSRIVRQHYQIDVSMGHNFVHNRAFWFCSTGVVVNRPQAAFAFRRATKF